MSDKNRERLVAESVRKAIAERHAAGLPTCHGSEIQRRDPHFAEYLTAGMIDDMTSGPLYYQNGWPTIKTSSIDCSKFVAEGVRKTRMYRKYRKR
ncbi:MAG: hypothetical protein A4E57_01820 [Syntrophorhabdaceae bacterium PtaU1.Bin034]|jgi:hypothetical protein|nr:MAG: hypothetical protein A4E57_01820 [Syntrophorhabdaceae bacterium PtaU1.Bin034]